jgi:tetratricopeptide (TPR) repeat protein
MYNQVLWTLDNEMDGTRFERLCTDLLVREGYKDIVPIGGNHDRGRDAELRTWKGLKSTGGITFFQYSIEKKWERKLREELDKVHTNRHVINFYVFVTTQSISGSKRDKLVPMAEAQYKWHLIIYDREWLRLRLEEVHPDLAAKYLGISVTSTSPVPLGNSFERAWQLYLQHRYEAAAAEFHELLKRDGGNLRGWQALSWCQYSLFHYKEALLSINHSLTLKENDEYSLSMKACILTEDGIQSGDKAKLLLAREIFRQIAPVSNHWTDHYNFGNLLNALGDYEGAKSEFLNAIEQNPGEAEIWKNLGSVYFHLGDNEREIQCYDQALALNSKLSQAYISKGVTLLTIFGKAHEAAQLIERGIEFDESLALHWPHAWYWLAKAYCSQSKLDEALKHANAGLSIAPSHLSLLNLKAWILSKLWRKNIQYLDEALEFFRFRIELSSDDYDSLFEILHLYKMSGKSELIWQLVEDYFDLGPLHLSAHFRLTSHNLDEFIVSCRYLLTYKEFRKAIPPIQEYFKVLNSRGISSDEEFEQAMFVVCGIPFGLACDILANASKEMMNDAIGNMRTLILDSLGASLPRIASMLSKSVKLNTPNEMAEGLSLILVTWPDIALVEFSRQVGYIGGIFGASKDDLDKIVVQGERLGEWQKKILTETFFEINKQLKIFKE